MRWAARFMRFPACCDRRGSVAIIAAGTALPLIVALGTGVDLSRLALAKGALQSAVDHAALAGAAAYQADTLSGNAATVASRYFDQSTQGPDVSLTARQVSAAPGTFLNGTASFNVTVGASATLTTTFMAVAGIRSMDFSVRAVAANPASAATSGSSGGSLQPVIQLGTVGSTASDWNSAYMYSVPNGSNGKPDYNALPPLSSFYEIGSNCNQATNIHYTAQSICNGGFGATVSPTSSLPKVLVDQPIAFMFVNMNNGMWLANGAGGYGANQYGAQPGNYELMSSAPMSLGQGPSQNTDNSTAIIRTLTGYTVNQPATTYSTLNGTAQANCAIQIQQVDPNNVPSNPPYPGQCFSATDPRSGYQYANLSCSQMAGRTFMYWWNDMGAPRDDFDYKNLYFTVRCTPGGIANGGALVPGSAGDIRAVTLIQ